MQRATAAQVNALDEADFSPEGKASPTQAVGRALVGRGWATHCNPRDKRQIRITAAGRAALERLKAAEREAAKHHERHEIVHPPPKRRERGAARRSEAMRLEATDQNGLRFEVEVVDAHSVKDKHGDKYRRHPSSDDAREVAFIHGRSDVITVPRAAWRPHESVFETAERGRRLKKEDQRVARGPCACGHPASKHPGGGACAHFARSHFCPCVMFRARAGR
jgi:hypothetical protein